MKRGPSVGSSYSGPVNQITGKVPLYKPSDKGDMMLRVLPAFENGAECPWVDFESDLPDNSARMGDQHYELDAVQIFTGNAVHMLSSMSKEEGEPDEAAVPSPAVSVAHRISTMVRKCKEMQGKGYTGLRTDFLPNKFGQSWISVTTMTLVQALLYHLGGQPVRDRDGNPFRYCVVNMTSSAMRKLREKLFAARVVPASGDKRAYSLEQSQFGDYVSCAGGSLIVLSRDVGSATPAYTVQLGEPLALDTEWSASQWRPWSGDAENAIYKIPTHTEVMQALSTILTDELIGFGLIGSNFEPMLTPTQIDLGKAVTLFEGNQQAEEAAPVPAPAAPSRAPGLPTTGRTQSTVPNQAGAPQRIPPSFSAMPSQAPKAPAALPSTVNRGPVPPRPPSTVRPQGTQLRSVPLSAFPKPAVTPVSAVPPEMEQLPHLGETQEAHLFDPAAAVDVADLPTVDLG